jgi:hypothetical protein
MEAGAPEWVIEYLPLIFDILFQIGKNRVEIESMKIDILQWFDLLYKQIQHLSGVLTGLDKER